MLTIKEGVHQDSIRTAVDLTWEGLVCVIHRLSEYTQKVSSEKPSFLCTLCSGFH